jgi:hypothetical protein
MLLQVLLEWATTHPWLAEILELLINGPPFWPDPRRRYADMSALTREGCGLTTERVGVHRTTVGSGELEVGPG